MIVVFDASSFIAAALKADSVPERAIVRAMTGLDRRVLSQEAEYRQALFRPKFHLYVSAERRRPRIFIVSSDLRHSVSMHPWRGIPILLPSDFLALP